MTAKQVDYIRCPFCAFSKVIHSETYEGGTFLLGELRTAPSEFPLIEVREALPGPGRGHKGKDRGGIRIVETLDIKEALAHPEYRDLALQVKARLIGIIRSYVGAGVIDREELI